MSTMLLEDGRPADQSKLVNEWRDRITQARDDRKRFEATWMSNLAFASGKHWLAWNPLSQQLELPSSLRDRELYTADVITERRLTALGELGQDDDRPQLLLVGDGGDDTAEGIQEHLNRALSYGWDHEWKGERALQEARQVCIDLGTSAIRARYDATAGPPLTGQDGKPIMLPWRDGRPELDPEKARALMADAYQNGDTADMRPANEGRICWEPLSPFQLLVPPGVHHEDMFPWEIIVRPTPLEQIQAMYPTAADMVEDSDISSVFGVDQVNETGWTMDAGFGETRSKLKGHAWLYTCYERPSARFPCGRTVILGGREHRLLHIDDHLPCKAPDGTYVSGIAYFHWWKVTGRFWSRSLVEALKDPQRIINRRKTQNAEIIDRGMPKVFVEEGSLPHNPAGLPLEKIEVKRGATQPSFHGGVGPGEWMYRELEEARVDLEHASGMRGPSLGDNPTSVTTYSQLALLAEKDQVKRSPMLKGHHEAIGRLVEATVHLMRTYWGEQKQVLIEDEADKIDAIAFNASQIPDFFVVKVATGAPIPRSQAAELKKIDDIAQYSINAGQPLPVEWYVHSLEAGSPLEMPPTAGDDHAQKAEIENHWMQKGTDMPVMDYDPLEVHIPIHRAAQIRAELSGDMDTWNTIDRHIQQHEQVAAQVVLEQQQLAGPPPAGPDGAPMQQPAAPQEVPA